MDWRFVDDEKWSDIHVASNGAGVESMQAKWEEMFGSKDEGEGIALRDEAVKVKKPRTKAVTKKPAAKKPAAKKTASKRAVKKTDKKSASK